MILRNITMFIFYYENKTRSKECQTFITPNVNNSGAPAAWGNYYNSCGYILCAVKQNPQKNKTDGWHRNSRCPSCGCTPPFRYVWRIGRDHLMSYPMFFQAFLTNRSYSVDS